MNNLYFSPKKNILITCYKLLDICKYLSALDILKLYYISSIIKKKYGRQEL